jgi:hypothetical protein
MRVVKSPYKWEPGYMKLAYFTGRSAWRMHQIVIHPLFISVLTVTLIYGLMKLAGLSLEIFRHGDLLLRIK